MLLLPPPQATKAAASMAKTHKPKASLIRRCFPAANNKRIQAINRTPVPGRNQRGRLGRRKAADGAVVAKVKVAPPPPGVSVLALRVHVL